MHCQLVTYLAFDSYDYYQTFETLALIEFGLMLMSFDLALLAFLFFILVLSSLALH